MPSTPIDRRTLIRRAAIVGAAAWTAPVIIGSVASPAAAGSSGCITGSWSRTCSGFGNSSTWTLTITNSNGAAVSVTPTVTYFNDCVTSGGLCGNDSNADFSEQSDSFPNPLTPNTVNNVAVGHSATASASAGSIPANSSRQLIILASPDGSCSARVHINASLKFTCPGGSQQTLAVTGSALTCGAFGSC